MASNKIIARYAATFDEPAQLINRFELNLANAFPGEIEFRRHLFQRADFAAADTIPPLKYNTLLVRQQHDPLMHQLADFDGLQQLVRSQHLFVGDGVGDGMVGVDFQRRIE